MGRLLISAAHTLENPGAIYQDLREADLTRKLLKLCIPHLDKSGITYQAVPLDLPLLQRIEWINATGYTEEQGDIMVELHINDGGKRGIEGWYRGNPAPDNKSQRLTERLAEYICEKAGYTDIGSKSEYEHELTSLLILNSINSSGTAMEILFIDNPEDIAILKDDKKLDDLAKIIVDGIKDYLDKPDQPAKNTTAAKQPNQDVQNNQPIIQTNTPAQTATPMPVSPMPPRTPSFGGFGGSQAPRPFGGLGASGGFGGNSPIGSFGGGSNFGGGMGGGNKATLMDRDERKKMIKEIYQLILGKDPKPADENYYLNTGATKEELINKLTESEDFKNMIADAKKAKELEDNVQKLESEVELLKANSADSKSLNESMNRLLEQKNIMISRLYYELVQHGIIQQGEHFDSRKQVPANSQTNIEMSTSNSDSFSKKISRFIMKLTKV